MPVDATNLTDVADQLHSLAQGVYVQGWFVVGVLLLICYRLGRKS